MRTLSAWTLLALFSLLAVKGLGEDLDLSDAFDDLPATADPKPKPKEPAGGAGAGGDLDLLDILSDYKPSPKPVQPKDPVKPKPKPEETRSDFFGPTVRPALLPRTTTRPLRTSAPPRKVQDDDLDLSDAMNPSNDIGGKGKDTGKGSDSSFSDHDVALTDDAESGAYTPIASGQVSPESGASAAEDQQCERVHTDAELESPSSVVDAVTSVKNELKRIGDHLCDISLSLKELVKK
ncbi:CD99 antigen-like protein 2 isoform X2 [Salminus brasiliensis]|uniref:CD99 antigen-like protein 2 isoform X2 n=1 Tax=Salminus brasiliensis TaxID=930266 RepID=UPI003B82F3C8